MGVAPHRNDGRQMLSRIGLNVLGEIFSVEV